MDELRSILSEFSFEPWNRFTLGLIAAIAVARGLDFLSTWIVTPTLALEANPLMRRTGFVRMALLDNPTLQHNGHILAEAASLGEVMGDQDHRQVIPEEPLFAHLSPAHRSRDKWAKSGFLCCLASGQQYCGSRCFRVF